MSDERRDADSKANKVLRFHLTNPPIGFKVAPVSNKQIASEAARLLGSIKTPRKAKASRENGKLGGRPRKTKKRKAA